MKITKLVGLVAGIGVVWEGYKTSIWLVNQPSDLAFGGGLLLAAATGVMAVALIVWSVE